MKYGFGDWKNLKGGREREKRKRGETEACRGLYFLAREEKRANRGDVVKYGRGNCKVRGGEPRVREGNDDELGDENNGAEEGDTDDAGTRDQNEGAEER